MLATNPVTDISDTSSAGLNRRFYRALTLP
jgi:hypothetical protein